RRDPGRPGRAQSPARNDPGRRAGDRARCGYRPSAGTRGHQRIATDERESVVPGSRVVESHEAELSTAGVGPKADDVVAAEEAEARLVQGNDRPADPPGPIGGGGARGG